MARNLREAMESALWASIRRGYDPWRRPPVWAVAVALWYVECLVVSIAESCEKWLAKQGYGEEAETQEEHDAQAVIQAAALAGKAALGARAGKRARRIQVLGGRVGSLRQDVPPSRAIISMPGSGFRREIETAVNNCAGICCVRR